ncbi:MAG TPA: ferritin family protein [Thermotogota bacterium]|mgnify:CR=1 FL=1|nr:ferritin family protein [Thermotogota bacterium]HRW91734.1 ferritin family protein [Thermotogota bacterium]
MDLNQLLNVALKIESKGFETYSRLAETQEGSLQALFSHLAQQEREHAKTFKSLLELPKEEASSVWWVDDENAGYMMSFAEMSIFPNIEKASAVKDLQEAFEIAIEVEKDSILFYNDLYPYFPDKKAIEKIIAEEKKHLIDLLKESRKEQ